MNDRLKEAGLIGSSIIPTTFKNQVTVHATYGAFGNVQAGQTYSVADTQSEPTVSFNAPPGKDSRFTVASPTRTRPRATTPSGRPSCTLSSATSSPDRRRGRASSRTWAPRRRRARARTAT